MERFTSLARALLNVSNKQLKEEQHRYEKAKAVKKSGARRDVCLRMLYLKIERCVPWSSVKRK